MAGVVGSIIGNSAASGDSDAQKAALQQSLQNFQGINVPTVESQELNLQNEQSAGQLTPQQLQDVQQGKSNLANITTDPRLAAAQMQALSSLQQQGRTGLSDTDKQALLQINNNNQQQSQAANASILQNMAQRGMGGSGASLAAQLSNAQNSAQRAQTQGSQVAGQAQQAALQATANAGNLATQTQGQQFQQKAQQASAQDAIDRFNAQNKQNVMQNNVQSNNQAQAANLANKQNISNFNTGLSNTQQQYNKNLLQTNYANQLQKAGAESGAENNLSGYYGNQASQTRGMWSGIGQGIDQGAAAAYGAGAFGSGSSGGTSSVASGSSGSPSLGTYNYGSAGPRPYAQGGKVEASNSEQKAEVKGDSLQNDKIPIEASEGEVVVPCSIIDTDSDAAIAAFVKAASKK